MNTQVYLREYSSEEKNELDKLLKSSIARLPFTLSSPIRKLSEQIVEENYSKAINYALDFFEISAQYLSCILIALLQEKEKNAESKHEALVRAIIKIDTKRPLSFGDWVNDIYTPLLKAATERIPDNELVIHLNGNLINKGCHLFLGGKKDASIIQIRNEYKGHSTTLSESIYKDVIHTLEPRIFSMLKAVSPLQDWQFFSCNKQIDANQFSINMLNGSIKETIIDSTEPLEPQHYYIELSDSGSRKRFDLFPLIFTNENKSVYVFQSLKDEKVSYVSSDENARTLVHDCWNESFDTYLQRTLPSFDISKELNWKEIKNITKSASRIFLEHAYKEKKYNQELFVDRTKLTSFFKEFQYSDKTLFPLLGEAGQGKTNQLCYWTEDLIKKGKGVLIFNSSGFSENTLEEKLKKTFNYNTRRPIQKLLDSIHRNAVANNATIHFFFDAVNECLNYKDGQDHTLGPLYLYQDIRKLLIRHFSRNLSSISRHFPSPLLMKG